MTLLLQQIIEPGRVLRHSAKVPDPAVVNRLQALLRHHAVQGELQIFKLSKDFGDSAIEMLGDESVHKRMIELARTLADFMWIECPVEYLPVDPSGKRREEEIFQTQTGMLLLPNGEVRVFMRERGFDHILQAGDLDFRVDWGDKTVQTSRVIKDLIDRVEGEQKNLVGLVFAILALMNIPGAQSVVSVVPNEKLQRARARAGKERLVTYKQVDMVHQHPREAHRAESAGEGGGKRRHHVIGHIRLLDHDPLGRWTWVKPHWRGDAARGLVLKERRVV